MFRIKSLFLAVSIVLFYSSSAFSQIHFIDKNGLAKGLLKDIIAVFIDPKNPFAGMTLCWELEDYKDHPDHIFKVYDYLKGFKPCPSEHTLTLDQAREIVRMTNQRYEILLNDELASFVQADLKEFNGDELAAADARLCSLAYVVGRELRRFAPEHTI